MRGRDELISILACPPVDLSILDLPDDREDITPEQHEQVMDMVVQFWHSEGVEWADVLEVAAKLGAEDVRTYMAGIALTPDELDEMVAAFTAAHLGGFIIGWMMARGMGLKEETT